MTTSRILRVSLVLTFCLTVTLGDSLASSSILDAYRPRGVGDPSGVVVRESNARSIDTESGGHDEMDSNNQDSMKKGFDRPGCHLGSKDLAISVPGCVEFDIRLNTCRGFCVSYSVPSGDETRFFNPSQVITSVGQCCNIMETQDLIVRVMCHEGFRDLTFKNPTSCGCYHCKRE